MDKDAMRKQAESAKKRNIFIFCIFVGIFAVLVGVIYVFKCQHTFSQAKWDADMDNRYQIVFNMLARTQLVGMTESEVVQLLGPEDSNGQTSFKGNQNYFSPESTLVYYLGVDFMDNNWLVISLDSGVVSDYCIGFT